MQFYGVQMSVFEIPGKPGHGVSFERVVGPRDPTARKARGPEAAFDVLSRQFEFVSQLARESKIAADELAASIFETDMGAYAAMHNLVGPIKGVYPDRIIAMCGGKDPEFALSYYSECARAREVRRLFVSDSMGALNSVERLGVIQHARMTSSFPGVAAKVVTTATRAKCGGFPVELPSGFGFVLVLPAPGKRWRGIVHWEFKSGGLLRIVGFSVTRVAPIRCLLNRHDVLWGDPSAQSAADWVRANKDGVQRTLREFERLLSPYDCKPSAERAQQ